jgi:hypothetical protein
MTDIDAPYEEWVGHPNRHEFVLAKDHSDWSNRQGWWATGWRYTADEVARLKRRPQPTLPVVIDEPS